MIRVIAVEFAALNGKDSAGALLFWRCIQWLAGGTVAGAFGWAAPDSVKGSLRDHHVNPIKSSSHRSPLICSVTVPLT